MLFFSSGQVTSSDHQLFSPLPPRRQMLSCTPNCLAHLFSIVKLGIMALCLNIIRYSKCLSLECDHPLSLPRAEYSKLCCPDAMQFSQTKPLWSSFSPCTSRFKNSASKSTVLRFVTHTPKNRHKALKKEKVLFGLRVSQRWEVLGVTIASFWCLHGTQSLEFLEYIGLCGPWGSPHSHPGNRIKEVREWSDGSEIKSVSYFYKVDMCGGYVSLALLGRSISQTVKLLTTSKNSEQAYRHVLSDVRG